MNIEHFETIQRVTYFDKKIKQGLHVITYLSILNS